MSECSHCGESDHADNECWVHSLSTEWGFRRSNLQTEATVKTTEKRKKRCLACKGKQANHKCYGSWVEERKDDDVTVVYSCSCPKCWPKTSSLSSLLP